MGGQVAVITGGSGGIGWASAQEWLALGGKVVIADIQEDQGRARAASHPDVTFVPCDTRRRDDLEAVAAAAVKLGDLTCWFNNAGFFRPDSVDLLQKEGYSADLRNMVDVNLHAHMEGAGVALRNFGKRGGTIVSTASMAGVLPLGAPPIYSASKAAVVHFTRALGLALGEDSNVRAYCLCPTYTATAGGPSTEEIQKSLGGVLIPEHMGQGFILFVTQRPPNGSVMRVTLRGRGAEVVHDLVVYGKEQGGTAPVRDGIVLKKTRLQALTPEERKNIDEESEARRKGLQAKL